MKKYLLMAALLAGACLAPQVSYAAAGLPQSQSPSIAAGDSLVQQAHYGRCRFWRHECRRRWGFGWRFRRCMVIHGCW